MSELIPKHGGFRKLRSFQVAQQVYDGTVYFCNRFIDKRSRTHDQMVQAAREAGCKTSRKAVWRRQPPKKWNSN